MTDRAIEHAAGHPTGWPLTSVPDVAKRVRVRLCERLADWHRRRVAAFLYMELSGLSGRGEQRGGLTGPVPGVVGGTRPLARARGRPGGAPRS
jgi:hypothetical protein